jgi:PRTRC genetic system ThiF family protein
MPFVGDDTLHTLDADLLRRPVRVLVVGCGGTGSVIAGGLPYLHQAMLVAGHPGGLQVTLMDADTVLCVNTIRQPFCQAEVGLAKAAVMVSRLNLFWGLSWTAVAEELNPQSETANFDLWIGCVDTRAARKVIQYHVQGWRSHVAYWLDIGNSADSGQFVVGQPWNGCNHRLAVRLRTAREFFQRSWRPHWITMGRPVAARSRRWSARNPS